MVLWRNLGKAYDKIINKTISEYDILYIKPCKTVAKDWKGKSKTHHSCIRAVQLYSL